MGSFRGKLIPAVPAVLLPAPGWAQVCEELRPGWDGTPVSAWAEALSLFTSPAALVLLAASAAALRYRSQWGALGVCVGWSLLVSAYTFFDPAGGARGAGIQEGCVGSPTVFIVAVGALCAALVVYTVRPTRQE